MPLERWLQAYAHDAFVVVLALTPPSAIGAWIEPPAAFIGSAASAALRRKVDLVVFDAKEVRRCCEIRLLGRQAVRHHGIT